MSRVEGWIWILTKNHGLQTMGPMIIADDKEAKNIANKVARHMEQVGFPGVVGWSSVSYDEFIIHSVK